MVVLSLAGDKAFAYQIHLTTAIPRRLWFAGINLLEMPLHGALKLGKTGSLECFNDQIASRFKPLSRKIHCQLAQIYASGLVRGFHPTKVGGEVGQNKVGFVP